MSRGSKRAGAPPAAASTDLKDKGLELRLEESPAPSAQPLALAGDRPPSRAMDVARPVQGSPTAILLEAIQRPGLDLAMLEKLMDLQDRWAKEEARKAFVRDMAAFKLEVPVVRRNKLASVEKNGQKLYDYTYATLAAIVQIAVPLLAKHGFSHSWSMEQEHLAPQETPPTTQQRQQQVRDAASSQGVIRVTCTITHRDGHSMSVQLFSLYDNTGGKNAIQAIGSANSYLQRYTFLAAAGMSTGDDEDDDGKSANGEAPISPDQVKEIEDKIAELNDEGALTAILKYVQVDSLADIPIQAYELTLDLIARRKRHKATQA